MLTPKPKHVAIRPLYDPDMLETASGVQLIIPDTAKGRCDQGIVKYVGEGCKLVSVLDHVVFSGYSGTLLDIEGEDGQLIFMPEKFITCIVHDEPLLIPGLYLMHKRESKVAALNPDYSVASLESIVELTARQYSKYTTIKPSLRDSSSGTINQTRAKYAPIENFEEEDEVEVK